MKNMEYKIEPIVKQGSTDSGDFLNQFDFGCKYNKNFNRQADCSDYMAEIKKEISIELQKYKNKVTALDKENEFLSNKNDKLKLQLKESKKKEVSNLVDMAKAVERLCKHDSMSRLKMIQMLHDFSNIQKHIVQMQSNMKQVNDS